VTTDHHGKKILFLTSQLPYPPHQGGAIRTYNMILNLAPRHEIHLLSFVNFPDDVERAAPLRQHCRTIEVVPVPRRSSLKRLLTTLFSPLPDMALRLPSAEFRHKLAARLESEHFDVVQVESIEMAPYAMGDAGWEADDRPFDPSTSLRTGPLTGLRASLAEDKPFDPSTLLRTGPSIGLRAQGRPLWVFDDYNAEYVLQQRAFETDVRHPRRWIGALYSFIQWQKLRRYEAAVCQRVDRVIAVSEADREILQKLAPGTEIAVIPNGVDTRAYDPGQTYSLVLGPHSIVFTGKMDFRPNIDAVLWFCHQVLPLIKTQVPDVHFYIVGQKPPQRLRPLAEDPAVTLTGYVDDAKPYIAGAGVYAVPLRIGGGTRLKIMEAMALGKAIVSTSLGCEGYPLTSGRELVIADTPQQFAHYVSELLGDARRREELGRAGRRFVEERYDWRAIVPRLERIYEGELSTDSGSGRS
jgi:glycosyltransferase involved in cell wall biosynthesis